MKKETKELIVTVTAIATVLGLLIGGTVAFAGMYPPFTVVNSGSMQHSEDSGIGIVDAGDLMVVQKNGKHHITTYVEGQQTGYSKFGEYGDVIVYDHPDRDVNIIHRAMLELELVTSNAAIQKWHIPSLRDYTDWEFRDGFDSDRKDLFWNDEECVLTVLSVNRDFELTLTHVGYGDLDVGIGLWNLGAGKDPGYHGYLTKGDNANTNRNFDQNGIVSGLVTDDMVVSTAEVEIPWLGCIKLMMNSELSQNVPSNSKTNLFISFGAVIGLLVALYIVSGYLEKRKENDRKR